MTRLGARAYLTKPSESQLIVGQIEKAMLLKRDPMALYIRENIRNIHVKEDVVKQLKISQGTVFSRVKKVTGLSFKNFHQVCRIEKSQKYLIQGNLTVQEIATKIGMDPSAFSRIFSQYTGRTPLQFRREIHSALSHLL